MRRTRQVPLSKSFSKKPDALAWARKMKSAAVETYRINGLRQARLGLTQNANDLLGRIE